MLQHLVLLVDRHGGAGVDDNGARDVRASLLDSQRHRLLLRWCPGFGGGGRERTRPWRLWRVHHGDRVGHGGHRGPVLLVGHLLRETNSRQEDGKTQNPRGARGDASRHEKRSRRDRVNNRTNLYSFLFVFLSAFIFAFPCAALLFHGRCRQPRLAYFAL
ncbi:unnamed protein product [Hapterophycus canaliculatus]